MRRTIAASVIGLALLAGAVCAQAQAPKAGKDVGETYNPLLAEKDLEVGLYYFKNKSYDAAIERLKSCLVHRPNYAMPRWYLAQSYEKRASGKKPFSITASTWKFCRTPKKASKQPRR